MGLRRYKGFDNFSLAFRDGMNVLVGPNNAGKSTIIAALRLCSLLLATARRLNPSIAIDDGGRKVLGYPLALSRIHDLPGYSEENVHYEFRDEEARIELHSTSGACLTLVWPVPGSRDPYFYFDTKPGINARKRMQVADNAADIGVIPALTPIDANEEVLTHKYVTESLGSRLTSRHFRNHLYHLKNRDEAEYEDVLRFITENTPEISQAFVRERVSTSGLQLDFFFEESNTHAERELYWAGDGMQIWLQVLFHAYRLRNVDTLVLDEPDVFLHPDLQRRLVNVLEELGPQVVLATHAPEVIAESSKESVALVDRSRKQARRVRDTNAMDRLVTDLGSAFDLGIARALRSRVALFVEGQDMKILRLLARKVGAINVGRERNQVSVVPLGGYSNWPLIEPFVWMKDHLLQDAVKMFVFLDRDYRQDAECQQVVRQLGDIGVSAHVWRKKELESYLLHPAAISRVTSLPIGEVERLLSETIDGQNSTVESCIFSALSKSRKGRDPKNAYAECRNLFESMWALPANRAALVPPKEVIALMNVEISKRGGRTLSAHKIASELRSNEIDSEMADALMDVEQAVVRRI